MHDEPNDTEVIPDEMQSIRESEDGIWSYEDCGHIECEYASLDLTRAWLAGKIHSAKLHNPEVDWQIGVYNRKGILLDTISTKD